MEIEIQKKRIKRYIMKFDYKGTLKLSVPLYASKKDIESFISKNQDWINKNYSKSIDESLIYGINYPFVYILGERKNVIIKNDDKKGAELIYDDLIIHKRADVSLEKAFTYLEKFLNALRISVYQEIIDHYLELTGLSINSLKIKTLTASRGRCYPEKKEIILAKCLIHKKKEYIEAVVLHEIAHLVYPNHSQDFYNYIYKFMPDYKERHNN